MPELPEVETVRRGLLPAFEGARILHAEARRADLRFPFPERFADRLAGRRIERLGRRAKYLLAHLDNGEALVMHLGMTGRFTVSPSAKTHGCAQQLGEFVYAAGGDPAHDHVILDLSSGARVVYNDARRFGFMLLVGEDELETHKLFRDLGPEPLGNGLDAAYLAAVAAGRRVDLKAFLMDQRTVAGLGNIYVSEALFRAGLKPSRQASTLGGRGARTSPRAEALVVAIRAVISEAIEAGGSTLRDYRHADGALGYFQHAFAVYGRAGEPCTRPGCRGIVRRTISAGRSTFHCRVCQR